MRRDEQDYPIIPHEAVAAVDCGGCLYIREHGDEADIVCNECGVVVRIVRAKESAPVMNALITEIAATAFSTARCPRCGALNTFPGFTFIETFVCSECGEGVTVEKPVQ